MDITPGISALRTRAKACAIVIGIFIASDIAQEFILFLAMKSGKSDLLLTSIGIRIIIMISCVIAVGMWTYRANANLRDAGEEGMEFTPGWAVGWYFIPIANLFKPLQAMREIWQRSLAEEGHFSAETPALLTRWWACWIISNLLTNLNERLLANDPGIYLPVSILCSLLTIGAGYWLIEIILTVTAAQSTLRHTAHVFS